MTSGTALDSTSVVIDVMSASCPAVPEYMSSRSGGSVKAHSSCPPLRAKARVPSKPIASVSWNGVRASEAIRAVTAPVTASSTMMTAASLCARLDFSVVT